MIQSGFTITSTPELVGLPCFVKANIAGCDLVAQTYHTAVIGITTPGKSTCINANKTPRVSLRDGARALEVAHQIIDKIS